MYSQFLRLSKYITVNTRKASEIDSFLGYVHTIIYEENSTINQNVGLK